MMTHRSRHESNQSISLSTSNLAEYIQSTIEYYKTLSISKPATSIPSDMDNSNRTKPNRSHRIQYHHHLHNHYIHSPTSNPLSLLANSYSNTCKIVICCIILCMIAYYCLFVTFFSTNTTFATIDNAQKIEIQTNTVILNSKYNKQELRKKFEQRRAHRKQQRIERKKYRQMIGKHEPFAQIYISDAPYYMNKNLVISGLVHNSEQFIDNILQQLESVACLFNSTTFIFFESNSEDNTLQYLQNWKQSMPFDCSSIHFNPKYKNEYHNIGATLDELINVFNYKGNDLVDRSIINYLRANYVNIEQLDLKQIADYLDQKLRLQSLSQMQIEEIIYEKLIAIKYVTYHRQIEKHVSKIFKNLYSGDNIVSEALAIEREILRQLRIYGSVNELHTNINEDELDNDFISDYNGLDENGNIKSIELISNTNELDAHYAFLKGIKEQELRRHSHSDFVDEFGDIHNEVEQLIQFDEDIIYQRLKERRQKQIENRNRIREQKKTEMNINEAEITTTKGTEAAKFREKLFRIERFVIYRNMLLNMTQLLSRELNINFDYMLAIDMDIYSIDVRTFMNELYFMPHNLNGLCIDGIDWMGYTRDTFATVKTNGGWLHYGHDALIDNTKYIYDNQHAMYQRTKVPNDANRFEEVKSCFGGIMIYKNRNNHLFNQKCRYTLTRDIFYTNYNNTQQLSEIRDDDDDDSYETKQLFNYTYLYWLTNRYHNDYSEQSKLEIKLFIKQYVELLQVFEKTVENRELIPTDGDICEHIPYHYCLWDKGFKFAISSRAKLYYDKFYPINRNDTNWANYIANRAKFTLS